MWKFRFKARRQKAEPTANVIVEMHRRDKQEKHLQSPGSNTTFCGFLLLPDDYSSPVTVEEVRNSLPKQTPMNFWCATCGSRFSGLRVTAFSLPK